MAVLTTVAAGWASGCANQGTPPGGPEDRRPPVVVRTDPEPFAVVEDLSRPIRFYFDERISEAVAAGALRDAVTVSPRGGEVEVGHDSRALDVRVAGGLRAGVVYRVTLLAVVRDLFGNQMQDPFELVFSTGAEPTPTTVAGEVWDRITGQGVRDALVHAVGADSLVHVARTDAQGIFALRYLPAGPLVVTGFEDANRDGEVGAREVKGSVFTSVEPADTILVDVPVLPPDTTPAVLGRATALDSITVVLEFDDYLDPGAASSDIAVDLGREAGGAPAVSELFHEHEYGAYVARVADSLAAAAAGGPAALPDTAAAAPGPGTPADSTIAAGAPPDTAVVTPGQPAPAGAVGQRGGPPPLPGARGQPQGGAVAATTPERVLPGRRLVARLAAPLELGIEYRVGTSSVVNLNGLAGGGGEATVVLEAPPPGAGAVPDSTAADTLPGGVPGNDAAPGPPPGAAPPGAAPPGGRRR